MQRKQTLPPFFDTNEKYTDFAKCPKDAQIEEAND